MFAFVHVPWMLIGLAALAVPVLIHLLNRRRYDVVDWGAMQFLKVSETTRKRILLEELLLMLLRMALLAALVVGLAGPFVDVKLPRVLAGRPPRDVVLVIDGSASMGATGNDQTPAERARDWSLKLIDELSPGDGVAVLLAREQPIALVAELSPEHDRVRRLLGELPPPAGSCAVTDALRKAVTLLATSQKKRREVVFLTDGQKAGLADANSMFRLEMLAGELGPADERPTLWAVNFATGRDAALPNWALSPLRCNRPVVPADREVTFSADVVLTHQARYAAPHRLRLEIDGKPVRDLAPPKAAPSDGRVPFTFTHRFRAVGSHLVSVLLEVDPPGGLERRDRVPGDNRQDFAVEVVEALPVLIADGEASAAVPPRLGSDFLRDALSPARDTHPVVKTQVVTVNDFAPPHLSPPPRAVILHDVARLRPEQQAALTAYVEAGGGLLVALGGRAEAEYYNDTLFRDGLLPARLDGLGGDETKPRDVGSFTHPALELFRKATIGGLGDARFPRWWKLTTPGQHAAGSPVGLLQTPAGKSPFLVERAVGSGRVLLCAVPLDASWGSNLIDLPAFVPLAHELVYYLAGARSSDFNLPAGQPIRHRIEGDLAGWRLSEPNRPPMPLSIDPGTRDTVSVQRTAAGVVVYDGARTSGIYTLLSPDDKPTYFVVPADAAEGDLTPLNDDDREKVKTVVGLTFDDGDAVLAASGEGTDRQDLWLYLLIGMIGLLCLEVWMTRRLVKNR
jgi:hypothetical protein